jgi:hypothetical protein
MFSEQSGTFQRPIYRTTNEVSSKIFEKGNNSNMQTRILKSKIAFALCAFAALSLGLAFSAPSYAAKGPGGVAAKALNAEIKAAPKYNGKVTAVDPVKMTITIQDKKQPPMTFNVTSATRIRFDKAKSTFSDIKIGMKATIHSTDKVTALSISQHDKATPAATPTP